MFPVLSCSSLLGRTNLNGIDTIPAVVEDEELATRGGGREVEVGLIYFSSGYSFMSSESSSGDSG